ncbi:MAG: nucleotidyltransferase domain-containing protein [Paludibacteraceae bacterium]|jgi:predicted nucleotidyltransferase|nr:nucleotidyltransferase domain-containing protein [Paludibacteraceae bacterium]
MPTAEVQNMIPKMQRFFATQPVNKAYLFGSCSRGEETKNSDVDILVDLDKSKPIGLFQYVTMKLDLQDLLQREVDLVEQDELLPFAQETANRDKLLIYERA